MSVKLLTPGTYGLPIGSLGGAASVSCVARLDPRKFIGCYYENFSNGPGLSSVSKLAVSSEALIAEVSKTLGSGTISLPVPTVVGTPFAFGALIEMNAEDDGGQINIGLENKSVESPIRTGISCTAKVNKLEINAAALGAGPASAAATVPAGLYEFYLISDGKTVTWGFKPVAGGAITPTGAPAMPIDSFRTNLATAKGALETYEMWAGLNTLTLSTSSTKHLLLGVWVNTIGLTRPPGGAVGANGTSYGSATHVPILTPTDYIETVRIPKTYDGSAPVDFVFSGHPNISAATVGIKEGEPAGAIAIHAGLLDNGYLMGYCLGDVSSAGFENADASSWGAAEGQIHRAAFIEYMLKTFPQIRNIYWLGQSMGNIDGLNFIAQRPGVIRALVGISGVCNLSYGYVTESFKTRINTAYGVTELTKITDHDPVLKSASYANVPILHFHGTADVTVHKANHPNILKPLVEAQEGVMTVVPVTGGGHLDSVMWGGVSLATILSFLAANI